MLVVLLVQLGMLQQHYLWIGGQVSAIGIVKILFLPSIMCFLVPLVFASFKMKGFAVLSAQVSMAEAKERRENAWKC